MSGQKQTKQTKGPKASDVLTSLAFCKFMKSHGGASGEDHNYLMHVQGDTVTITLQDGTEVKYKLAQVS